MASLEEKSHNDNNKSYYIPILILCSEDNETLHHCPGVFTTKKKAIDALLNEAHHNEYIMAEHVHCNRRQFNKLYNTNNKLLNKQEIELKKLHDMLTKNEFLKDYICSVDMSSLIFENADKNEKIFLQTVKDYIDEDEDKLRHILTNYIFNFSNHYNYDVKVDIYEKKINEETNIS